MAKDYVEVQTPPEAFGIVEHGIYRCEHNEYRMSQLPHRQVIRNGNPGRTFRTRSISRFCDNWA
jgi:hypothetical protein